MNNINSAIKELHQNISEQMEASIFGQLNDFVSRGLIEIESTVPVMVQDQYSAKITVQTKVNLRLKDREYIESLERQVKELMDLVSKLREPQPQEA